MFLSEKDINKYNQKGLSKLEQLKNNIKNCNMSADDLLLKISQIRKHLECIYPHIVLNSLEQYPDICHTDKLMTEFEGNTSDLLEQDYEKNSNEIDSTMKSVELYVKAIKKLQKIYLVVSFVYCPNYEFGFYKYPIKFRKLTIDDLVPIINNLIKSVKSYLNSNGYCNPSIMYLSNIKNMKSLDDKISKLNHYLLTSFIPEEKIFVHTGKYFLNHFNIKNSSTIGDNDVETILNNHKKAKYIMVVNIDDSDFENNGKSYLYKYSQSGFNTLIDFVIGAEADYDIN